MAASVIIFIKALSSYSCYLICSTQDLILLLPSVSIDAHDHIDSVFLVDFFFVRSSTSTGKIVFSARSLNSLNVWPSVSVTALPFPPDVVDVDDTTGETFPTGVVSATGDLFRSLDSHRKTKHSRLATMAMMSQNPNEDGFAAADSW